MHWIMLHVEHFEIKSTLPNLRYWERLSQGYILIMHSLHMTVWTANRLWEEKNKWKKEKKKCTCHDQVKSDIMFIVFKRVPVLRFLSQQSVSHMETPHYQHKDLQLFTQIKTKWKWTNSRLSQLLVSSGQPNAHTNMPISKQNEQMSMRKHNAKEMV